MVVLLRSTDGNPDSRYEKYVNFLDNNNKHYLCVCWDRNLNKIDDDKHIYFHHEAFYGGGVSNFKNLILFNIFIFHLLLKRRKHISIIHAADFDTVIPAVIMKLLLGKRLIYDIYDWYIDSRSIHNVILKSFVLFWEWIAIKCADRVIICEPERSKQIVFTPRHLWILPNIPDFDSKQVRLPKNKNLIVAYVGILGKDRGLEKIIKYSKEHAGVHLYIGGFGPLSTLLDDVNMYPNIKYYGKVSYVDAIQIMNTADLIYAVYEKTNPNHLLAAPNKYYEGLYLSKPIITTKGTIVGDKVEKFDTGYTIEESYEDLVELFDTITERDLILKSDNSQRLWNEKYSRYTINFLSKVYLPFVERY